MGTQHAGEACSNASISAKFGRSYSVFARDPMQNAHDALVAKSLDLLGSRQNTLKYQTLRAELPAGRVKSGQQFHANSADHWLTRAPHASRVWRNPIPRVRSRCPHFLEGGHENREFVDDREPTRLGQRRRAMITPCDPDRARACRAR